MSDQPGIPALTVFPPFNPAASRPAPPPAQPAVPEPTAEAESAAGAAAAAGPESTDAPPSEPASASEPARAEAPEAMPWDAELAGLEAPEAPADPTPWDAVPPAPADEPSPWDAAPAAEQAPEIAPWDAAPPAEQAPERAPWEAADEPAAAAEPWQPAPPAVELDFAGDPALWAADDDADVADPLPWDYEAPELQTPEAAEAAAEDAPGEEDLPWLELPPSGSRVHTVDEPAAEAPTPEPALDAAPEWMDWAGAGEETAAPAEDRVEPDVLPIGDLEAAAEPPAAEVAAPFAEPETTSVAHGGSWLPPAEEERSDAEVAAEWTHPESAAASEAAPASAPSAPLAGAFDDVAARLESIARALRDDPQAFLSGAGGGGDPLSLLVAGFALGVNAARGAGNR